MKKLKRKAMLLRKLNQRMKDAHCFYGMLTTASITISLNACILHVTCFVFIVNWPWTLWAITSKSYCAYSLQCHSIPIGVYAGTGAIHLIRPSTKCDYHFSMIAVVTVIRFCVRTLAHLLDRLTSLLARQRRRTFVYITVCDNIVLATRIFFVCCFLKFTLYRSVSMTRFGSLLKRMKKKQTNSFMN